MISKLKLNNQIQITMLENLNGKSLNSPVEARQRESHWNLYIQYSQNEELSSFTKVELKKQVEIEKKKNQVVISSKILLSNLLEDFKKRNVFFSQFETHFKGWDSGGILGMQLYIVLLEDDLHWIYEKTKDRFQVFPSSIYFLKEN